MIIIHKKGNFIRHHCIIVLPYIYEEIWQGVALINDNLSWPSPFFYYIYICCSVFGSFLFFLIFSPVGWWGRGWNLDFDLNLVYCPDDGTYTMKKSYDSEY